MQPAAVLRYLADLAAVTATNGGSGLPDGVTPEMLDLTRTGEPAAWLGTDVQVPVATAGDGVAAGLGPAGPEPSPVPPTVRRTAVVRHLVALDALQPTAQFGGAPSAALIARPPRLQRWIRDVVDAAGLPPLRTVPPAPVRGPARPPHR